MDPSSTDTIARQTFEVIAASGAAASHAELDNIFFPVIQALGFSLMAGFEIRPRIETIHFNMLFGKGLDPWRSHYQAMQFSRDDPTLSECFMRSDPFYWSEIRSRSDLTERASRVFADAENYGLRDGLLVPLHRCGRQCFGVLLAGGAHDSRDAYTRGAAQVLATHYGMAGLKIGATVPARDYSESSLTQRQMECLSWVRCGKSSTDIAAILGISSGVVDEHIANACRRLGVRTRHQAVETAIRNYGL